MTRFISPRLLSYLYPLVFTLASLTSLPAAAGDHAVKIGIGNGFGCALTDGGGVKCWGVIGYLGDGRSGSSSLAVSRPVDVQGLTSGVVDISVSGGHACAVTDAGAVKCWGANDSGQLGDGKRYYSQAPTPVDVVGLSAGVKRVFAFGVGYPSTCAALASGQVKCWGNNFLGQMGNGTHGLKPVTSPVDVAGLPGDVVAVTGDGYRACAQTASGSVLCWGGFWPDNNDDQNKLYPQIVASSGITRMFPGSVYFPPTGLTTDGQLMTFLSLHKGYTADPVKYNFTPMTDIIGLPLSGKVLAFSGKGVPCLVTAGNTVECWEFALGREYNPVCAGSEICKSPIPVSGFGSGVIDIDGSCALKSSGKITCLGKLWEAPSGDPEFGDVPGFGGPLSVSVDEKDIKSPSVVTAKVSITNESSSPIEATLSFTDSDTLAYARMDDQGETYDAIDGVANKKVTFKTVTLAARETKTLEVPLVVNVQPDTSDLSKAGEAKADFTLKLASGQEEAATLTVKATPATDIPPAVHTRRLLAMPVADMGTSPDAPFSSTRNALAGTFAEGPGSISEGRFSAALPPSLTGNAWDYWIDRYRDRWSQEDKTIYWLLHRAGFSSRAAYAAIYLKALKDTMPSFGNISRVDIAKAGYAFWKGYNQGKYFGKEDGLLQAAKDILGPMDKVAAMYITNLMELHENYTAPLVEAMQDNFRAHSTSAGNLTIALCGHMEEGKPMTNVPFAKLVAADLNYRVSTGRFYGPLHNILFKNVLVNAQWGGSTSLSSFLEYFIDTDIDAKCDQLKVASRRFFRVRIHSPLTAVITAPSGQKAGVDVASGIIHDDISGAVIEPGHPWTVTVPAIDGDYRVDYGTAYPDAFGIEVQGLFDGKVTSESTYTGTATTGFTLAQKAAVKTGKDRVTVSVDGASSSTQATVRDEDRVFNWVEKTWAQYFAPAATSQSLAGYYFRHYPATQSYLATYQDDGFLYYLGPLSNNQVYKVGPLSDWLSQARDGGY